MPPHRALRGLRLSPPGRGSGFEIESHVLGVVATESGDEADGEPQPRRPQWPVIALRISVRLDGFHAGCVVERMIWSTRSTLASMNLWVPKMVSRHATSV